MTINTAIEIKKNIKIGEKDQIMYENKNWQKDYFSPLPHPHPPLHPLHHWRMWYHWSLLFRLYNFAFSEYCIDIHKIDNLPSVLRTTASYKGTMKHFQGFYTAPITKFYLSVVSSIFWIFFKFVVTTLKTFK